MRIVVLTYLFLCFNLGFSQTDSTQIDSSFRSSKVVKKVDSIKEELKAEIDSVKKARQKDSVVAKKEPEDSNKEAELKPLQEKPEAKTESPKQSEADKNEVVPISEIVSWGKIIWSLILIVVAYFIIRFLVFIVERLAERSTSHRLTFKSMAPVVRIAGWTLVIFIIIQGIFRPPIETLIAVTASVGIAIGFAAQDILKNIFGGIMILFDRPFQVGDKIEVGDHYGEVTEIGLRSTRIVTKDDSLVSIPNAEVVNKAVSNANSGETNCQVVAEIYLPIDIDTNEARQLAIQAAQVSQYIYLNKPISVLFINEVREKRSYLKMRLKAYVSDIRYEFAFQSEMTEIVMKTFLEKGLIKKEELL